jgi:hypothetical protein
MKQHCQGKIGAAGKMPPADFRSPADALNVIFAKKYIPYGEITKIFLNNHV